MAGEMRTHALTGVRDAERENTERAVEAREPACEEPLPHAAEPISANTFPRTVSLALFAFLILLEGAWLGAVAYVGLGAVERIGQLL